MTESEKPQTEVSAGPPPLPKGLWHYAIGDERKGPVAASKIAALVKAGELDGDSLIWKEGWPDWKPLQETELAVEKAEKPVEQELRSGAIDLGTGATKVAAVVARAGNKSPIVVWAKGGAVGGFVLGFAMCTGLTVQGDPGEGLGLWVGCTILGAVAGVLLRKWIFRTFWM